MTTRAPDPPTPVLDRDAVDTSMLGSSTSVESAETMPRIERKGRVEQIALFGFVTIPFLALLSAIPFAWGWGLGWHDMMIAAVAYGVSGPGVTVGFHRCFPHGSFNASRSLPLALALSVARAVWGQVIRAGRHHRPTHPPTQR